MPPLVVASRGGSKSAPAPCRGFAETKGVCGNVSAESRRERRHWLAHGCVGWMKGVENINGWCAPGASASSGYRPAAFGSTPEGEVRGGWSGAIDHACDGWESTGEYWIRRHSTIEQFKTVPDMV
eukprot:3379824-Rhodomonas_salina.4